MPKDHGKRSDKKLSWMYRNKKRISRNQRSTSDAESRRTNVQIQNKKARIVIRNLPFKVTEDELKKHYDAFGEIEEVNLLRHANGKLVGCGFVQFKKVEQASRAIFNTNRKDFLGRVVSVDWAIAKNKFSKDVTVANDKSNETDVVGDGNPNDTPNNADDRNTSQTTERQKPKKLKNKIKNVEKRARIIVRNLSFDITEELLREHFDKFGPIKEVKILTRPDGKLVGCAFIQFTVVQHAAKAMHYTNLKPLLGRKIVVDWAIPKDKFGVVDEKKAGDEQTIELKKENDELNVEVTDDVDESYDCLTEQNDSAIKTEDEESIKEESDEEVKSDFNETDDSDVEEEEFKVSKCDIKDEIIENSESPHPKRVSNDVSEGKTVFIKNVPFSVTNEELKQCMEQYGPVCYALVCKDHLTDHSKGTAFVKFQSVEDAEKCLSAGTELRLCNQVLDPHRALNRNEIQNKSESKKLKATDSRNLYLVKEGVILAGSPAAIGVSSTDMARRLQLEQWKSQMLRNLNMFVSRVRLVVHNLPTSLDDKKLRDIFQNHSGPKAVIREARVMRDLRNIDANGIGQSKEYGFVAFTSHEDALKALRAINNNPNIFGPNKRPIVAFSIENRIMVNAIQRRVEKSRERNPLWTTKQTKDRKDDHVKPKGDTNNSKIQSNKRLQGRKRQNTAEESTVNAKKNHSEMPVEQNKVEAAKRNIDEKSFAGITSKPGQNKLRSKFVLKKQAALHNEKRRTELKSKNLKKRNQMKRHNEKLSRKEVKVKQGRSKPNQDDVNFSKLVNNYKTKLMAVPNTKSKWYETQ